MNYRKFYYWQQYHDLLASLFTSAEFWTQDVKFKLNRGFCHCQEGWIIFPDCTKTQVDTLFNSLYTDEILQEPN